MELQELKIEATASAKLPWQETIILPIGDLHLGGEGCAEDKIKRHINWGLEHNAYFLGMGDLIDPASPSNRQHLKSAALYDSVEDMLEEGADLLCKRFIALAHGTEGRWLGMLEGHHFYEFRDGTTSDMRIAQALKAPFLGTCCFVRLRFNRTNSGGKLTTTIWAHHGTGGGIKQSAPLNKLENLVPYFKADIYLIGHHHKRVSAPIDQLYMTEKKPYDVKSRPKFLACTGGFFQGYKAGSRVGGRARGNYVERKLYNPVSMGGIIIRLRPTHTHDDDFVGISVEM